MTWHDIYLMQPTHLWKYRKCRCHLLQRSRDDLTPTEGGEEEESRSTTVIQFSVDIGVYTSVPCTKSLWLIEGSWDPMTLRQAQRDAVIVPHMYRLHKKTIRVPWYTAPYPWPTASSPSATQPQVMWCCCCVVKTWGVLREKRERKKMKQRRRTDSIELSKLISTGFSHHCRPPSFINHGATAAHSGWCDSELLRAIVLYDVHVG